MAEVDRCRYELQAGSRWSTLELSSRRPRLEPLRSVIERRMAEERAVTRRFARRRRRRWWFILIVVCLLPFVGIHPEFSRFVVLANANCRVIRRDDTC